MALEIISVHMRVEAVDMDLPDKQYKDILNAFQDQHQKDLTRLNQRLNEKWTVIAVNTIVTTKGGVRIYYTLHKPDSDGG